MARYFKPAVPVDGRNLQIIRKTRFGKLVRDQLPFEGIYTPKEMAAIVEPSVIDGQWFDAPRSKVGYVFGLRQLLDGSEQLFPWVQVIAWAWSHNTNHGNGVYSFVIVTPDGKTLTGKTEPNGSVRLDVGSWPDKLRNVHITQKANGNYVLKAAIKWA